MLKPRTVDVFKCGVMGGLKLFVLQDGQAADVFGSIYCSPVRGSVCHERAVPVSLHPRSFPRAMVSGHESQHPTSRENVSDWLDHRIWNAEKRHSLDAQAPQAYRDEDALTYLIELH